MTLSSSTRCGLKLMVTSDFPGHQTSNIFSGIVGQQSSLIFQASPCRASMVACLGSFMTVSTCSNASSAEVPDKEIYFITKTSTWDRQKCGISCTDIRCIIPEFRLSLKHNFFAPSLMEQMVSICAHLWAVNSWIYRESTFD